MNPLQFVIDFLNVVLPAAAAWWGMCRALKMSARTRLVDRMAIVALTAGCMAFALDGVPPLLRDFGFRVPEWILAEWAPWESWKETLLFAGVLAWCGLPTLRERYDGVLAEHLRRTLDFRLPWL